MNSKAAADRDPATAAEWQSLKTRADDVRSKIDYINSLVDKAANWVSDMTTLNREQILDQGVLYGSGGALGSLGFIPALIPLAYVTAAIAGLVYVTGDIYKFTQKLALVEQGKLPASELDKGALDKGTDLIKQITLLALVGGAIYFFWKYKKGSHDEG